MDLVRETGSDTALSRPLVRVRADSELALASLLGLGCGPRPAGGRTHPVKADVVFGLVLGLALALAMVGLVL